MADNTSDFSDDDLAQILGLSVNASKQNKLELQQRLANALRSKGTEKGQSVPMGSVFLPPSPLTTAMDTFDHLQGIMTGSKGQQEGNALDIDRLTRLMKFAKMWHGNSNPNATPQPDQMGADSNDQDLQGML